MSDILLPFKNAVSQLHEADMLLFKGTGFIGKGISFYSGGKYSHAAIVHFDNGKPYCVEQREFRGGRSVLLKSQVDDYPGQIDVYRAMPIIQKSTTSFVDGKLVTKWTSHQLGDIRKKEITDLALSLTGQPYSWKNIWKFCLRFLPFIRLSQIHKTGENGDDDIPDSFVCSTVLTYCYRKVYADPCPHLSDVKTSPSDLGKSFLFSYVFTLE